MQQQTTTTTKAKLLPPDGKDQTALVYVPKCPFCGKSHTHHLSDIYRRRTNQHTAAALCGKGKYQLDIKM